ncbi:hypothetical protein, partial [Thermostaphylospora chromogena]
MTAHLSDADRRRLARSGPIPLSTAEGMALFDAALAAEEPVLAPGRFDMAALREGAADGTLPP